MSYRSIVMKSLMLAALAPLAICIAQEIPVEDVAVEDVPVQGEVLFLDSTLEDGFSFSDATIEINTDFAPATRMGGAAREQDLMQLLNDKSVRQEIELVDEQYAKMKEYNKRVQSELREISKKLLSGFGGKGGQFQIDPETVSYTHLTLPTICSV